MAEKGLDFIMQMEDPATSGTFHLIGGFRTNSMTINSESVDITSKTSGGWRKLLAGAGVRSMSLSGSGVFENDSGFANCMQLMLTNALANFKLQVPNYGDFDGSFQITTVEMAGEHNGEVTYSLSLESDGPVNLTPAA